MKLLKPKGRHALQLIEIYARKYYKSKVKEQLDQLCKENRYDRMVRFVHMKCLMKEAFNNESADVKCEIEAEAKASRELSAVLEDQPASTQGDAKQLSAPSWQL